MLNYTSLFNIDIKCNYLHVKYVWFQNMLLYVTHVLKQYI